MLRRREKHLERRDGEGLGTEDDGRSALSVRFRGIQLKKAVETEDFSRNGPKGDCAGLTLLIGPLGRGWTRLVGFARDESARDESARD